MAEDSSDFLGNLTIHSREKKEECAIHNQDLSANCKNCDQLVCIQCVLSTHNGHILEELSTFYRKCLEYLKSKESFLKKNCIEPLKSQILATRNVLENEERDILDLKATILQEYEDTIARVSNEKTQLLNDIGNRLEIINTKSKRMDTILSANESNVREIQNLLKGGSMFEVIRFSQALRQSNIDGNTKSDDIPTKRCLKFVASKFEGNLIGTLMNAPCLELYGTYPTDIACLSGLRNIQDGETWVTGVRSSSVIKLLVPEGKNKTAVRYKIEMAFVYSLANTKEGNILMTKAADHKIYEIDGSGTTTVFTEIANLFPLGIDVARNGDIYACASEHYSNQISAKSKRCVLRLSCKGDLLNSYEFGDDGSYLFTYPSVLTENMDGTICVIDRRSHTSGRVVALDNAGIKQFVYDRPPFSDPQVDVDLKYITHDALGHIFISDFAFNCIHMLRKDGVFLCYIAGPEIGLAIRNPSALHVDRQGYLWIGCMTDNLQCNVLKYKIS